MFTDEIRRALTLTEHGNSLYASDDGDFFFVAHLGRYNDAELFFIVKYIHERDEWKKFDAILKDYPAFGTFFVDANSVDHLRRELQQWLTGWYAVENALGLALDEEGRRVI